MTSIVWSVDADTTLRHAAGLMAKLGIGALPVLDGHRIVGIVTDRDIAVRGLAAALPPGAPVSAVMTGGTHACRVDEEVADTLLDMELLQIRRMPVVDDKGELVGMVSLGDLVAASSDRDAGRTFKSIAAAARRGREPGTTGISDVEELSRVA
jgi:CBS domain-containing protein